VDTVALRGLLPARLARPAAAEDEGAWLLLFAAGRLAATIIAFALVAWAGLDEVDALLLLYGPLSTAALLASPALRHQPWTWVADIGVTLIFVIQSGDWRSPY